MIDGVRQVVQVGIVATEDLYQLWSEYVQYNKELCGVYAHAEENEV